MQKSQKVVKVLLPVAQLFPLSYLVPEDLEVEVGDLVIVPFRSKEITGIVFEEEMAPYTESTSDEKIKLRPIKAKVPLEFRLKKEILQLITKAADYYFAQLGSICKLVLPVDISEPPIKVKQQLMPEKLTLPPLSESQNAAMLECIQSSKPVLLKGVTGSGKTEVYFHLIKNCIEQNKQALIMLPEISLSMQIIERFTNRFGFEPVVWNSDITKAQKKMALRGILNGSVKIVIGARSSLFLPYSDLGLIIVDEEHDGSYKQEDGVLYHARDMAVLRASLAGSGVVLCSATPSIETIYNVDTGKYQMVTLASRYRAASMPDINIIDLKAQNMQTGFWLSQSLVQAISDVLDKKEQVLLFLNRRGYAPLMLCKSCGYRFSCSSCSAWLVMHKSSKKLECHHCGYVSKIHTKCPDCKAEHSLIACGPGVERIEEEVRSYFQNHNIAVVSKDHIDKPQKMQELLQHMKDGEIDILIGTQMITKGYHFPNLTLVGVVDADIGIAGGDLRSHERTYQLLHQVGGRAGRESKKGAVLLQTYNPEHVVLSTLKNDSEEEFIKYEIENRRSANMPPFSKIVSIILTDKNESRVFEFAKSLVAAAPQSDAVILGPAKALMSKIAQKYRYRILLIVSKKFNLQQYLQFWFSLVKVPSSCHVKVDVDPQSFV